MSNNKRKAIFGWRIGERLGKAQIFILIFAVLSILITLFILSNSLLDFETSHQSSGVIVEVIIPDDAKDVLIDDKTPEYYLRKCVHFLEYAALGYSVMSMLAALAFQSEKRRLCISCVMFYTLFIAVFDEHLQSFSDRSSSTSDILLDFAGALFGILIAVLLYFIHKKIRQKRNIKLRSDAIVSTVK